MSIYKEDNELTQVNREAAVKPVMAPARFG